ncbi:hypothetical protein ACHWR2_08920 [Weissella paramesenteroides]
MMMNNKDRTVQILSGFSLMMLIFISIINPQNHSILYHFFTWLTWPTIFFIAGYTLNVNTTLVAHDGRKTLLNTIFYSWNIDYSTK